MKNILITGAASGIGLATARLFHARGWSVGLIDKSQEALAATQSVLPAERVWRRAADVTDPEAVAAALAEFVAPFDDQLTCLFNNAGVLAIGRFEDTPIEQHARTVSVNVLGVMNCCHAAYPYLRGTPGARVINASSASTLYGVPHFASYSASKFAVRGLTEALNLEWAESGITVSDIMPPFVNTPMMQAQAERPPILERMGAHITPEAVAEAVWQAQGERRVHKPITARFAATFWAGQFAPTTLLRAVMAWLNRPATRAS